MCIGKPGSIVASYFAYEAGLAKLLVLVLLGSDLTGVVTQESLGLRLLVVLIEIIVKLVWHPILACEAL